MIGFILFALAATVVFLELYSLSANAARVRVDYDTDLSLVEPGEIITLRYTVQNLSALPKLYIGLSFYFSEKTRLCESESWMAANADDTIAGISFRRRLSMPPHSRFTGKVRFCLTQRGVHVIGKHYLEVGDFLGLRSKVISVDANKTIVCTARADEEEPDPQTLGGLLGEISVRRFIHEDPTLVVGYRDYTGREPMRLISWTATAKTGQLMVKELDHTVDTNVAVVVNMQDPHRKYMERCMELVRTVCDCLEARKIPYALLSNGDLGTLEEGLGKSHSFYILRKIGLSRLVAYEGFPALTDRCCADLRGSRSYIVVTPVPDAECEVQLRRLRSYSDCEPCVLYGNGGAAS